MKMRRSVSLLVLFVLAALIPALGANAVVTVTGSCAGNAAGDFNGDLFDDLAVGTPGEQVGSNSNAGGVDVFYGNDTGLNTGDDPVFLTQNSTDVEGVAEAGDRFGACVAAGDYNGDGFDDLAIGAPGEGVGDLDAVGYVHVIYGSDGGLDADGSPVDQLWSQDSSKVPGVVEDDDEYGSAMVAGDFDGDERDDLAVGASLEDIAAKTDAGAVNVMYGTASGLSGTNSQLWHQDTVGAAGKSEKEDLFGYTLAAGDLDGTGRDDLVIGAPGEDVNQALQAGAIQTLLGSAKGLTVSRDRIWTQDSTGVIGTSEDDDQFGAAVAVGDFDGDGYADAAVGVPSEDLTTGPDVDEGVIQAFYGTETGLTAAEDAFMSSGNDTPDGMFGASLAAGDVDGDSADELAVGAPLEDATGLENGVVYVVEGDDPSGLDGSPTYSFDQSLMAAPSTDDDEDHFGSALVFGNFDGSSEADDAVDDLAIGQPGDDFVEEDAGAINVVTSDGTVDPNVLADDEEFTQDDGDDTAEEGDAFGSSLG